MKLTPRRQRFQRGFVLWPLLLLFGIGAGALMLSDLDALGHKLRREERTANTLSHARGALLGYFIQQLQTYYLPLPDFGLGPEGTKSPNFSNNCNGCPVVGRLPWKTLGLEPMRDAASECLWYAVAGRFKEHPTPRPPLNWDTWENDAYDGQSGRLRIAQADGSVSSEQYAALVIAPGRLLAGQSRHTAGGVLCSGNYDPRNYLDPWNLAHGIGGRANYFPSDPNHRVANNSQDKEFIIASDEYHNDLILGITATELFDLALAQGLTRLLADAQFSSIPITGAKGTDALICADDFCRSWRDHLFLTQLIPARNIIVDGVPQGPCQRVVIFGGKAMATQSRATSIDRNNPNNYLEGANATTFATPISTTGTFVGASRYNKHNRSQDIIRCIN